MLLATLTTLTVSTLFQHVIADLTSKPYKEHMYITTSGEFTFDEAFTLCSGRGGHLPSIHSQEDMDFLVDELRRSSIWLAGIEVASTEAGDLKARPVSRASVRNRDPVPTSFQWTDGSAWDARKEWLVPRRASGCSSCCGLVLSHTHKLVPTSLCDPSVKQQVVCRLPLDTETRGEMQKLREAVSEQSDRLSQRMSMDQLLYDKLVNATLTHGFQLNELAQFVGKLGDEVVDINTRIEGHEEAHAASNHTTMSHVGLVNETLHAQVLNMRQAMNQSSQSMEQELGKHLDRLYHMAHQTRVDAESGTLLLFADMRREVDRLAAEVVFLVILVAVLVSVVLAVPLYLWIRGRRSRHPNEDQVRLSQINQDY